MGASPTAIVIREICKAFPAIGAERATRTVTRAVDAVSLAIEPGELFFLLGPSGCGKTTLLRIIAGFIEPTSGRILFNGRDMTDVPPNRRNTGMVFQSYALWPHMTVEANVAFGLSVRAVPPEERRRRVAEALQAVQMSEYATRRPTQLSGGQQQRVALARALVIRPDVLLLDEPLSNLDARLRLELRHEIRRICKSSGITTVYVTHDQKEALSMADRIAIMERGRVVQFGPPRELYRRPASRFVAEFLGETNVLRAQIVSRDDRGIMLSLGGGRLRAAASPTLPAAGASIDCSVRPEAWQLGQIDTSDAEGLPARVHETIYLGDQVQYRMELSDGAHVLAMQAAAGNAEPLPHGASVRLTAAPEDVVMLAGKPGGE